MKRLIPYLTILVLASGCYSSQIAQEPHIKAEPIQTNKTFWDNGQLFAYQAKDSVIISLGFNDYYNDEIIMDMTIDNQSSDTIFFDPQAAYMFRYRNDSLSEKRIYYAQNPELVLDSIDNRYIDHKKRIRRSYGLSALVFAAYITAEVAGANADWDWGTMEAIRFTHDIAQVGLDQVRIDAENAMYSLEFAGDYWSKGTLHKTTINPNSYESGKIHFKIPYTDIYKIYLPVEHNLYRFTFKGFKE